MFTKERKEERRTETKTIYSSSFRHNPPYSAKHGFEAQLPHRPVNQAHILFIPGDLVAFTVHHQARRGRVAQRVQLERVLEHKVRLADHVDARDAQARAPEALLVVVDPLIVLAASEPEGRHGAEEEGAADGHGLVGVLARVLGQEGECEGGAVGEAEEAVKGALGGDDVGQELVRTLHRLLVVPVVADASRPVVVAVVGALVDVLDARARAAAQLTLNVDEGCAVVFF